MSKKNEESNTIMDFIKSILKFFDGLDANLEYGLGLFFVFVLVLVSGIIGVLLGAISLMFLVHSFFKMRREKQK
jgi:hypothetical protein